MRTLVSRLAFTAAAGYGTAETTVTALNVRAAKVTSLARMNMIEMNGGIVILGRCGESGG